ncbi:MAG: PEP-CTERM sorting domain-containing protein [Pedosphaera sp.]|nr:PEP-CTERM sorting domain-containing protein [Pedosphaera sp.]
MSYREGFANNADPLLRPLTIDMVPEPSAVVLSILGGLGLLIWRRRR